LTEQRRPALRESFKSGEISLRQIAHTYHFWVFRLRQHGVDLVYWSTVLDKPNISDDTIIECLSDHYRITVAQIAFLPLGWVNNATYRVITSNGIQYFLKLRRGRFNKASVAIPAFLHSKGIQQVMAPVATNNNDLYVHEQGYDWILYPFFNGKTGFEITLSKTQWGILGKSMKAIHTALLPDDLLALIPQESFLPHWRIRVRDVTNQVKHQMYADPIAARLASFWLAKRDEIEQIVARGDKLALALKNRAVRFVVCHSDLHARNVLVGANDELVIVDWDEPIWAPKERDLMFIGGGIGGIWNIEQENRWFYNGYGHTEIDLVALSYYRYERIVMDLAEDAERILGMRGTSEERQKALGMMNQFLPNNVVDIANRTYQQLE